MKSRINRKIPIKTFYLKDLDLWAYSIGHFLNDMSGVIWFNYILFYLTNILNLSSLNAATIMLIGQLSDVISTPIMGIISDKFGKVRTYIPSAIIVGLCMLGLYGGFFPSEKKYRFTYYCIVVIIENIGVSGMMISHFSLIANISNEVHLRDTMVERRSGFTSAALIYTLVISYISFTFFKGKIFQYQIIAWSCFLAGCLTTTVFILRIKNLEVLLNLTDKSDQIASNTTYFQESNTYMIEFYNPKPLEICIENSNTEKLISTDKVTSNTNQIVLNNQFEGNYTELSSPNYTLKSGITNTHSKHLSPLFRRFRLYQCWIVYLSSMLVNNITFALIPYYLVYYLGVAVPDNGDTPNEIAIVFMVTSCGYVSNLFVFQKNYKTISRLYMLLIGLILIITGMLPIFLFIEIYNTKCLAMFFIYGIGMSITNSTSFQIINDMIGLKTGIGGRLYSILTLGDKIFSAITLFLIVTYFSRDPNFLGWFIPIFPIIATLMSTAIFSINHHSYKEEILLMRRYDDDEEDDDFELNMDIVENESLNLL